ncbi:HVO_0649 family zinc finger protein [Halorubrum sp. AD140]|uniref:HVO_0649 family zinc finger protein n=1 Tax=Halorubrum sp. AD140 TaxID=3050073 RepID=UPI002ACC4A51|nr:HVO_0649 family zinc finger protein [Halorubrum sp. AD140]MDZ5811029.1 HVO_0649 family zinc finger protein [Halorubrum sp. AD140]
MSSSYGGRSAFERLRVRLDERPHACRGCGFVDDAGGWEAATTGATVEYRRECPSCGTEHVRRYQL